MVHLCFQKIKKINELQFCLIYCKFSFKWYNLYVMEEAVFSNKLIYKRIGASDSFFCEL